MKLETDNVFFVIVKNLKTLDAKLGIGSIKSALNALKIGSIEKELDVYLLMTNAEPQIKMENAQLAIMDINLRMELAISQE